MIGRTLADRDARRRARVPSRPGPRRAIVRAAAALFLAAAWPARLPPLLAPAWAQQAETPAGEAPKAPPPRAAEPASDETRPGGPPETRPVRLLDPAALRELPRAAGGVDPLEPRRSADAPPPTDRRRTSFLEDDDGDWEAPLFKAQAGVLLWPLLDTSLQLGSNSTRIEDIEQTLNVAERWFSPWAELSFGSWIRVGVNALDLDRSTGLERVSEEIVQRGAVLARPGDLVETRIHYTQADLFVQWDLLYRSQYRIGVLGGARFLRVAASLRSFQLGQSVAVQRAGSEDVLATPFFGGQVELEPVPLFTVYANVRFIDWGWRAIGLSEQRTFEARIGFSIYLVEEVFGVAADFRFLSTFINAFDHEGERSRARYQMNAGGLGLTFTLKL